MRRTVIHGMALSLLLVFTGPAQGDSVHPAEPIDLTPPAYPPGADMAEGSAKVSFTVGTDGHVSEAAIVGSSGNPVLDKAALEAVSRWSFKPRTQDGRPVEQPDTTVVLNFKPTPAQPKRKLLFGPKPLYPQYAFASRLEGTVLVGFNVGADGVPIDIHVVESSSPEIFDRAAVQDVKNWLFEPQPDDTMPTTGMVAKLDFKLADARVYARPLKRVMPIYPSLAAWHGTIGSCTVKFLVETDGSVRDPEIKLCYPRGVFEFRSLDALKKWVFEPINTPAGPIEAPSEITFKFRMQGQPEAWTQYLKPGQWIELKYTLSKTGQPVDIVVSGKSEPDLPEGPAISQLEETQFAPAFENGLPVVRPNQVMRITN